MPGKLWALACALLLSLTAFLALPSPLALAMEVEFYAVTDREKLPLDGTLTLTITLSHDQSAKVEALILPQVAPDFTVRSQSQSEQTSFRMSGAGQPDFRKVRVYTFALSPTKTGKLQIPSGKLKLAGKNYETAPIQITVTPGRSGGSSQPDGNNDDARPSSRRGRGQPPSQQQPPDPLSQLNDMMDGDDLRALEQLLGMGGLAGQNRRNEELQDSDIFLRNVVDKKKVYLGEQVTMSLLLYARSDVSGVNGMKMPKLDGFWSEDIETPSQINGERRVIDGVAYRVFLLRRKALFPLKAGTLTIDRVEADISLSMGFFFSGGRKVQRKSAPVSIEVMPLPKNPPNGFDPANVGTWRLSAEASPESVPLNQPVTLRLTLEGKGNLRNISMPSLDGIDGFKAYEPTTTERISTSQNKFGGRRTFEYLLMPVRTGSFTIPALEFPFFDPAQKKYRTAKTRPIQLKVTAGTGPQMPLQVLQPGSTASIQTPAGPQNVNVLDAGGLKGLRFRGAMSRPKAPLFQRPWFIPLVLSPFFLWAAMLVFRIGRSALAGSGSKSTERGAGRRLRQRLKKAEKLAAAQKADEFYGEVSDSIGRYLADRLGRSTAGMARPELKAALSEAGASEELIAALVKILDACDAGRFAPGASEADTMNGLIRSALDVLQQLEAVKIEAARQTGEA